MNASVRPYRLLVLILLAVSLSSCKLPSQVTPSPVGSEGTNPVEVPRTLPTATLIVIPQVTITALPRTPTLEPTQAPTVFPTPTPVPASTNTPAPAVIETGRFSVVGVAANDILQVRQSARADSAVVDSFAYDARDILLTGNESTTNNARWVEVQTPNGGTGWVNARYLTEMVPPTAFCADPRVQTLLDQLKSALVNKDGQAFADLISPAHGLSLQYLRGGTIANYNFDEASWVFNSTFVVNWGLHPGSGLDVRGTFSQEVLPTMLDVFAADYQRNCAEIVTGGTTYSAAWPEMYKNINFIAAHRPGTAGDELNWRTWLVGIEYVEGEPYLFALNHLFWEP